MKLWRRASTARLHAGIVGVIALAVVAFVLVAVPGSLLIGSQKTQTGTPQDGAISWAQTYIGLGVDSGASLQFVRDAYLNGAGVDIGGLGGPDGALAYWEGFPSAQHPGDASPPPGALVFWGPAPSIGLAPAEPSGCVGLALNKDQVISSCAYPITSPNPNGVRIVTIADRDTTGYPYLGWMIPDTINLKGGRPLDGTVVAYRHDIYRVVGGAPLLLRNRKLTAGKGATRTLTDAQFNALTPYPANGTEVVDSTTGDHYVFAGGAPIFEPAPSALAEHAIAVDGFVLDNFTVSGTLSHVRQHPADGTFLKGRQSQAVYVVNGGTPAKVASVSGAAVVVDQQAIDNAGRPGVWNHLKTASNPPAPASSPANVTPSPPTCPGVADHSPPKPSRAITTMRDAQNCSGYWVVSGSGTVVAFGAAEWHGDLTGRSLRAPIVAIESSVDGGGYWLLGSDGGVFAFGDAAFFGSAAGGSVGGTAVAMTRSLDGRGYWIATSDGTVISLGDAPFFGSASGSNLRQPIVGIARSGHGLGYWLVAADGGVFAYGDAPFLGSVARISLAKPAVTIAAEPSGQGYWIVGADGGLFTFEAPFYGALVPRVPPSPIVAAAPKADGGYYMLSSAGVVYGFGGTTPPGTP
jgi:hypothetical protein